MIVRDPKISRALMLKQITHREAVDCYRGHLMIRGRWLADARRRFIRKLTTVLIDG